jgi:hypothetical protein
VSICCDQRFAVDHPSRLEPLALSVGAPTVCIHAMHSAVDWFAFSVWQEGHLIRSLSLSPSEGIMEQSGSPLSFEASFWAGERPVRPSYPLPFHPLDLGQAALEALFGFVLEGPRRPNLVEPEQVRLLSYTLGVVVKHMPCSVPHIVAGAELLVRRT